MSATLSKLSVEEIARIAYEADYAYGVVAGLDLGERWGLTSQAIRDQIVDEVRQVLDGVTPSEMHDSWRLHRITEGETLETEPRLVPYDELSDAEKLRDTLFYAIVRALS